MPTRPSSYQSAITCSAHDFVLRQRPQPCCRSPTQHHERHERRGRGAGRDERWEIESTVRAGGGTGCRGVSQVSRLPLSRWCVQGKRIVSLGGRGTDPPWWYRGAPWTRPHARCGRASRRRSRRRSPCSSAGRSSPAAPRARARRRRSERPRSSLAALRRSSAGRGARCPAAPRPRRARRRPRPRSASSPGPASRSGGRSRATAPGTRSRKGIVLLAFGVVGLAAGGSARAPAAVARAPPRRRARRRPRLGAARQGDSRRSARTTPGRVARLKGSIGYWNALALLADAALGLGLWLVVAVRERFGSPARRRCSSTRRRS